MTKYVVGGAVRDVLLGRQHKDIDYVHVGATVEDMLALGMQQVGADFPVFLDSANNEHALARTERKSGNGYKGFETQFDNTVTLEDDLVRRDLTINAMAVAASNWDRFVHNHNVELVIDPFNGLQDLQDGILRHVSDAFADDPLRVLRVARFQARYDFSVEPTTQELMRTLVNAGELDHLTPERVWGEMERAIMEMFPLNFFNTLLHCGALNVLMPELGKQALIYAGLPLDRLATLQRTLEQRIAVFCSVCNEEDIEQFFIRLKIPNYVATLSRQYRTLIIGLEHWRGDPEVILQLLRDINAFRQPNNLQLLSDIICVADMSGSRKMNEILLSFRQAQTVNFSALTQEQQSTLKGAEIGKALDVIRVDRIRIALNI
jgi:tRNA nucleotidyltransferase (CCA-adding enzyme)